MPVQIRGVHYILRKGSFLNRGESLHSHRNRASHSASAFNGAAVSDLVSGKVLTLLEDLAAVVQAVHIERLQSWVYRRKSFRVADRAAEVACGEAEDLLIVAASSKAESLWHM